MYIMSYLPQFSFHNLTTPAADLMQWLLWKSEIDVSQTIFCSLQGEYNFPVTTSVQASECIGSVMLVLLSLCVLGAPEASLDTVTK